MQRILFLSLGLFALTALGCDSGLRTVPVEGSVMWNGQPVRKAELTFVRQDAEGPAAIATTDADGRFKLATGEREGAVPGKYKVIVQKSSVADLNLPDPLPDHMGLTEYLQTNNIVAYPLLPARYATLMQTPLEQEVADDGNDEVQVVLEGPAPRRP